MNEDDLDAMELDHKLEQAKDMGHTGTSLMSAYEALEPRPQDYAKFDAAWAEGWHAWRNELLKTEAAHSLSAANLVRELKRAGHESNVDYTGGGVYTIFVSPKLQTQDGDERWSALVGPFGFNCEINDECLLPDDAIDGTLQVYVGKDDDGDTAIYTCKTTEEVVKRVGEVVEP